MSKNPKRTKLTVEYFQNSKSGQFYALIKEVYVDSGRTKRRHKPISSTDLIQLEAQVTGYLTAARKG
jgi:hypothetical protein